MKLGIVGAGNVVRAYHLPALQSLPDLTIEWIVDRDEKAAADLGRNLGVRTTLGSVDDAPEVDAALVAVPVGARAAVVPSVLSRGWHAFCEKPFALGRAEHEQYLQQAAQAEVLITAGYVRRFYGSTRLARRLIDAQVFGPVEEILAGAGAVLRRTGRGSDYYRGGRGREGGEFFETGSHLVDQVFSACGVRSYELQDSQQVVLDGIEVETSCQAKVELADGDNVPLSLVVSRVHDVYNGIVVRCSNASFRIGLMPEDDVALLDGDLDQIADLRTAERQENVLQAMLSQWTAFIGSINDGGAQDAGSSTGLLTTSLIDECYARSDL